MNKIKNVIICGLGAIGTAIGEKILNSETDTTLKILVDKNRLKKYTETPRVLNGKILNFEYITPKETNFKSDLIIIAVKSSGLKEIIPNLKNFITERTTIISLLNGVTSEELIAQSYGWDKILPAYYIGSSAMRTEEKISHDGITTIVFGSTNKDSEWRVDSVRNFLDSVNLNYKIPTDIKRSLWLKFMLNTACNQLSAILGLTFGEMQTNSEFKELATLVMKEVELCAKAEGIKNTETMIQEVFEHINTITPNGKTSMLQDVENNRKTEVELFAGAIISYGEKHNIPTPYNKMIKSMIDTIYLKQHK